jgi:integrase
MADGGGMYLEVMPNGSKYWRMKYRHGGKEKRLAFGVYPDVPLTLARERRENARKLLATDVDPGEHRKAVNAAKVERAGNSFEVIAREWFAKQSAIWTENHGSRIIQRLERDIFPWIGGRPIAEITAPDLLAVLRRIESRGAVETAHRAHQNCGQVFRYAIATGQSRFVFPGARTNGRPMSDNAVLAALRRMGFAKDEMSGHGFRAMARTILDEVLQVRPDYIEHQLAHAVRDPNGRAYNRTAHLVERKKMMQQWADYLDGLKTGAEVIPLRNNLAA